MVQILVIEDEENINRLYVKLFLQYYPPFTEKNIKQYFEKGDIPVFVYGDKEMVKRAFANKLSNG